MNYSDALAYNTSHHICPFCESDHPHKLHENELMFIIPARAPYVEDHLLIIPKRHVTLLQELTHPELQALHHLVDHWTNKLHTRHEAVNLLLRDGLANGKCNKSVNHLHFHLIPDCTVGSEGKDGGDREYLDDQTYIYLTQKMREIYS